MDSVVLTLSVILYFWAGTRARARADDYEHSVAGAACAVISSLIRHDGGRIILTSLRVRLLGVNGVPTAHGATALPTLLQLITSPHWAVQWVAIRSLAALMAGDASATCARAGARSPPGGGGGGGLRWARVWAVQVCRHQGVRWVQGGARACRIAGVAGSWPRAPVVLRYPERHGA